MHYSIWDFTVLQIGGSAIVFIFVNYDIISLQFWKCFQIWNLSTERGFTFILNNVENLWI
jgi:hypothetical protein